MDRFIVSLLLSLIVAIFIPWKWANQHLLLSSLIEVGTFTLGFLIYKFSIIKNNLLNFKKRWRWNVEERGFLHWIVIASWPLALVLSVATKPNEHVTFSLWAQRTFEGELLLLTVAAILFFVLIIFPHDEKEIWPNDSWNEVRQKRSFWRGFRTLQYFFPFPLIAIVLFLIRNGRRTIIRLYARSIQEMYAFAIKKGLSVSATRGQHILWWVKTFATWVWIASYWTIKGVVFFVGAAFMLIMHPIGRLTCFVLKPTRQRMPIVLLDIFLFLLYAKVFSANLTISLTLGMGVGLIHVTIGYWVANRLRKLLNDLIQFA